MTDTETVNIDTNTGAGSSEATFRTDPIEQMASQYGWKPEGKRSAAEYIKYALEQFPERGEALSKQARSLEHKDDELSKMKNVLSELTSHMKKQKDVAYQQALMDLQQQRRTAISQGDVEKVEAIDMQQNNLQHNSTTPPQAVEDFKSKYQDYLTGTSFEALEIQEWIFKRDQQLASSRLPPEQHMKELERHMLQKFPHYFEGRDNIGQPSAVDSLQNSNVAGGRRKKTAFSFNDLTVEQKDVANYLEQCGHMKKADYIKQLVENGDLQ